MPSEHTTTLNKRPKPIERTKCWTIRDPACLEYLDTSGEWPRLLSTTKVVCPLETATGAGVQSSYFLSGLGVLRSGYSWRRVPTGRRKTPGYGVWT